MAVVIDYHCRLSRAVIPNYYFLSTISLEVTSLPTTPR
nr:MAG TPA: hypothetical protein [Bacteriophage sp.]